MRTGVRVVHAVERAVVEVGGHAGRRRGEVPLARCGFKTQARRRSAQHAGAVPGTRSEQHGGTCSLRASKEETAHADAR